MSHRWRVLAFEFIFAIIILNITSANRNMEKSKKYSYGEPLVEIEDEQDDIKCQRGNTCEAVCLQQNKSAAVETNVFNDTRCTSIGYHVHFVFSQMTTLSTGWFVNNAIIRKITIRDAGTIVEIEQGAFDDCTFRFVGSLEIRGTAMTALKKGALAGLNNLKTLALYSNNEMKEIEENALEGLFQLEEFIMEEQKQLTNLDNVTGKIEWKYLRSLQLSKNSFGPSIKKPTFKGCKRLQNLNLSNSEIEVIGPNSFEPMEESLKILDLSNNRLKTLPSGLLENLIRPGAQFYLSNNLWDCSCANLELQGYDINNCSLIIDSPLICETPETEKGNPMKGVSFPICIISPTIPSPTDSSTPITAPPGSIGLDHLTCFDQNDSYYSNIAVETEYQFFNIKQEEAGVVTIEINYPDTSLALIHINDHDYKARCMYDLKRKMTFDFLNTNAGHFFCLMKKSSYTTSPRNCLPFHFGETNFIWRRDRVVITLACSFALATVIGVLTGWLLICRYRRTVKSKALLRDGPRNSRSKTISNEYKSWSTYQQKKFFMNSNNAGANLRRSYSANSLTSCKTYMTPSPTFDMMQRRNRNSIGNSHDYGMRDYIDKLPYDILPPPLPPQNGRRERIYETIVDPPFVCTSEMVPYVYIQRKY